MLQSWQSILLSIPSIYISTKIKYVQERNHITQGNHIYALTILIILSVISLELLINT